MNILLTSTGNLEDGDHKYLMKTCRDDRHIVETLPLDRLLDYLRVDPRSRWAAVDAIVCKADTDPEGGATYTLPRALKVADEFRNLPESCAMRDGRKWKSIPFIVISDQPNDFGYPKAIGEPKVTLIGPSHVATDILRKINDIVDEYIKKVLEDYEDLGLVISFEKGRARIGPALKKKNPEMESAYYWAPGDRRNNKRHVTVMRDGDGLRADVALFQQMLDMGAGERAMQRFFEDNPFFLTQARMGVQIAHLSYATNRWSPDFAFTSILGVTEAKNIEVLEIKGPGEALLNAQKQHPGFTAKLSSAINQVRDYGEYLHRPQNEKKLLQQLGYIPTQSKLAVLIGRAVNKDEYLEALERRSRFVPDIEIITYDKILETQASQMSRIVIPDFGEWATSRR